MLGVALAKKISCMYGFSGGKCRAYIARLFLVLFVSIVFAGFYTREIAFADEEMKKLPYSKEVTCLMGLLEYSGFPALMRPDVELTIDFKESTWSLKNIHKFDANGDFMLEGGRYGLCGELAAESVRRLKPIFGDKYMFRYVRVGESGYFLKPGASHIVVALKEREKSGPTYVVDPSLDVYDDLKNLDTYIFFETIPELPFITNKETDVTFVVDSGTPIFIHDNYLVDLIVERSDDKFDINNFVISLLVTKRYKFAGRVIYSLRNANGKVEEFENRRLANEASLPEQYEKLRTRIKEWFNKIYVPTKQQAP